MNALIALLAAAIPWMPVDAPEYPSPDAWVEVIRVCATLPGQAPACTVLVANQADQTLEDCVAKNDADARMAVLAIQQRIPQARIEAVATCITVGDLLVMTQGPPDARER